MKVLITTFGTRGDIQPFIAVGKGLVAAGHAVAICSSTGYRAFIEDHGLRYMHMDNELLDLTQRALSEMGGIRDAFDVAKRMKAAIRRSMDDEWTAAVTLQPDLILYHPKCLGSYHVAEKHGVPAVMSLPLPFYTPTREFPVPFLSGVQLGAWFNRLSFRLMGLSGGMYSGMVNDFRSKTLGLPPIRRFADLLTGWDGRPIPILYSYSRHVLAVPKDFPRNVHVTGYWFLDQARAWQPPAELTRFLENGTAPLYIGFGSMGARNVASRTQIVLDALAKCGQRAVLASGWGGLRVSDVPTTVLVVDTVPHEWLFPRTAAVVHHGGAGTTAAALRAGVPTLICPFMADQPFWGRLVHRAGVGPEPIPQKRLTVDGLARAIDSLVHDENMKRNALAVSARIRGEDGVARAVEIMESIHRYFTLSVTTTTHTLGRPP